MYIDCDNVCTILVLYDSKYIKLKQTDQINYEKNKAYHANIIKIYLFFKSFYF